MNDPPDWAYLGEEGMSLLTPPGWDAEGARLRREHPDWIVRRDGKPIATIHYGPNGITGITGEWPQPDEEGVVRYENMHMSPLSMEPLWRRALIWVCRVYVRWYKRRFGMEVSDE